MPDFSPDFIDRLARAERIAVLTGAGISAESGIPTFRDPDGLWEAFEPQELANVEAFLENPELVQGWYAHRRHIAEDATPNAGHRALAALEETAPSFTLITQNVDNLHQHAGSQNVVELHGNITRNYCIDCEREATPGELESLAEGEPAQCPTCGGYIRPDVVWFGEMLPQDALRAAQAATENADVFLSIGTSAVVHPAASLPPMAQRSGAFLAEVNLEPTPLTSRADASVLGKAGELLPSLVDAVNKRRS